MSNFNVFYRIRKINEPGIINIKNNSIIVENNRPRINNKKHYKTFKNLNIFDQNTTNYDIYHNYFKPKLLEFMKNDISTFSTMAYGQTGSGKTYTLFGNKESEGLIFNIIQTLFENNIKPKISCLQIYNNNIHDLLNNNNIIKIYDSVDRIIFSTNVLTIDVEKYNIGHIKINEIMNNRITGVTKLNNQSSRSHLIVTIHFNHKKIYIIDLAGNEKGKYSVAHKDKNKLNEYIHINKSLFSLKECIRSFSNNNKYIPYRNSKLTLLLKDVFFNNGDVSFIGNLYPMKEHFYDIIDTLKFSTSLQNKRIVLSIHKKKPEHNIKLIYINYILELYRLIYKDTELFEKVKMTDKMCNINDVIALFDEKITFLQKYNEYFNNLKTN